VIRECNHIGLPRQRSKSLGFWGIAAENRCLKREVYFKHIVITEGTKYERVFILKDNYGGSTCHNSKCRIIQQIVTIFNNRHIITATTYTFFFFFVNSEYVRKIFKFITDTIITREFLLFQRRSIFK